MAHGMGALDAHRTDTWHASEDDAAHPDFMTLQQVKDDTRAAVHDRVRFHRAQEARHKREARAKAQQREEDRKAWGGSGRAVRERRVSMMHMARKNVHRTLQIALNATAACHTQL